MCRRIHKCHYADENKMHTDEKKQHTYEKINQHTAEKNTNMQTNKTIICRRKRNKRICKETRQRASE